MKLTAVLLLCGWTQAFTRVGPRPSSMSIALRSSTNVFSKSTPALLTLRGGASASLATLASEKLLASPYTLFNGLFAGLAACIAVLRLSWSPTTDKATEAADKPKEVLSLQRRFLAVFWLLRMSDWMQGPYFYEVYASKVIRGQPASLDMVSKLFLVGFASTGLFGPWVGRQVDARGRKLGTLLFTALYSLGALSTRSSLLPLLLLGRLAGGIGTSLLFSAPEAWLVGESIKGGFDGRWLGQTFGWAYAGDSIVAIIAGQLASIAATKGGPSGPFSFSLVFLLLGGLLCGASWRENTAPSNGAASDGKKASIADALRMIAADKKVLLVGLVQALFEGAMYIFVLQWPPAIKAAIASSGLWASPAAVPYGNIFSCFMASCLLGSSLFGKLQTAGVSVERSTAAMLLAAAAAIGYTALTAAPALGPLVLAFFVFEACVGMYFPSIGTLRSRYLPDSHRSVMMNLFGIPLNLIVVSVFLSIKSLGVQGALKFAALALGLAAASMATLTSMATSRSKTTPSTTTTTTNTNTQ